MPSSSLRNDNGAFLYVRMDGGWHLTVLCLRTYAYMVWYGCRCLRMRPSFQTNIIPFTFR